MKNIFFSVALFLSSFAFGTTLDWEAFKIPHGEAGSLWAKPTGPVFFPTSASPPDYISYGFRVHESLFGGASNQVIQARYAGSTPINANCGNLDNTGYATCAIPALNGAHPLTELHMYGGNGGDYLNVCSLIFPPNGTNHYLPGGTFYGDKAWPHHGEDVPCAFNPVPLFPSNNGKNVMGTISLGHHDQHVQHTFNEMTTENPVIHLPINSTLEISAVAAAPYGQNLIPSITLIPAHDSVDDAPRIKLFKTEGKWPLPANSGYTNNVHHIHHNYKTIDDDLTTPHRYALRINRTEHHLHLRWSTQSRWPGDGIDEHFVYASQTIGLKKGPLRYHLQLALHANQTDPSVNVPVTQESYFNIFHLSAKDIHHELEHQEALMQTSSKAQPTQVVSLMNLLNARNGYHKGNEEKQVYWTNQTIHTPNTWTLNVSAIPQMHCDSTNPTSPKCTYASGWVDTYNTWSTGAYPRGMITVKVKVLPAAGKDAKGLWPAIWMLPRSNPPLGEEAQAVYPWPTNGELDIFEGWGHQPNKYASTLHYGADPATRWSYMGTEYGTPNFDTAHANEYAISWDFLDNSTVPVFKWWVKTPQHNNTAWSLVREQRIDNLAPAHKRIDCPALGQNFPKVSRSFAHVCFANAFRAGQTSKGLDTLPHTGYYLIANLAVGGYFDGDPVNDLSGSHMQIEAVDFYQDLVDPRSL